MRDDREQFMPLGPKVDKPVQQKPEWVPTDKPGIARNQKGQLRHIPNPPPPKVTLPCPYYGSPQSWGRLIEALHAEVDGAKGAAR